MNCCKAFCLAALDVIWLKKQDFQIKFTSVDFTLGFDAKQLGTDTFIKTNAKVGTLLVFSNFCNGQILLKEKQGFLLLLGHKVVIHIVENMLLLLFERLLTEAQNLYVLLGILMLSKIQLSEDVEKKGKLRALLVRM